MLALDGKTPLLTNPKVWLLLIWGLVSLATLGVLIVYSAKTMDWFWRNAISPWPGTLIVSSLAFLVISLASTICLVINILPAFRNALLVAIGLSSLGVLGCGFAFYGTEGSNDDYAKRFALLIFSCETSLAYADWMYIHVTKDAKSPLDAIYSYVADRTKNSGRMILAFGIVCGLLDAAVFYLFVSQEPSEVYSIAPSDQTSHPPMDTLLYTPSSLIYLQWVAGQITDLDPIAGGIFVGDDRTIPGMEDFSSRGVILPRWNVNDPRGMRKLRSFRTPSV
jgi:hypothetical protein